MRPRGVRLQQTGLQQERFDHFYRLSLFGQCSGQRVHAHRAADIVFCNTHQVTPIHGIEADLIDFKPRSAASAILASTA